jgi:superfamily II DNA or RNA helicase
VIATNRNFANNVYNRQTTLLSNNIPLQLWDEKTLRQMWERLPGASTKLGKPRQYQEGPIASIIEAYRDNETRSGLAVMATGLGKTHIAGAAVRQLFESKDLSKVLVLAHTNDLVYQLERSFWPFLTKHQRTTVFNGYEKGDIKNADIVFGCVDSFLNETRSSNFVENLFDMVIVDEAHHAGSSTYREILGTLQADHEGGPFLLGLTATPWRADENDIKRLFRKQLCSIDIVQGMAEGYLSNVDYRMHTNNIDWSRLSGIKEATPRALNRTLFIQEWDDAVVDKLQESWTEIDSPKAIVFCSKIEHAFMMRDKINARGFTRADAIFSGSFNGKKQSPIDRSTILCDLSDGNLGVVCAVNILNEGIDVPDVNIIVFQRMIHSRRIFVQQLGRGLRISPGKDKVIVLDFVSDIRRFAAGIELKDELAKADKYIKLGTPVHFVNQAGEDKRAEHFLREWIKDVAEVQDADEDAHILKYPPPLS